MLLSLFSVGRSRWLASLACVAITAMSLPAHAATASELLEKAIYTEETVGNLDEAIQIYEEVLTAAEKPLNAAAEAQFRIGECYAKQGKSDEAAKAFQAVVDGYPTAARWVARAKERLPSGPQLLPAPWGDGDEMHYEMKLANGTGIGYQVFRVQKRERDGAAAWECASWQYVTINGASGKSRVWADLDTFAPIESHWRHSMLGDAKATYEKDKVVIEIVGKDEPATIKFDGTVYDNEQGAEMFRRLPLKDGFKTKVDIISTLTGMQIPLAMSVTKVETIKAPFGDFECFRLHLDDLNQTFWISNDEHRYIVRFEAGGVTADLAKVATPTPEQPKPLERDLFSLTLPPNWYAYSPSQSENPARSTTWLIASEAGMNSRVEAGPLAPIQEKYETPSDWLEDSLDGYGKRLQEVTVTEDGMHTLQVNGQDAAVVEFDYKENGRPLRARRLTMYGEESAVILWFTAPADEFESWRPAIADILASLQIK